MTNVLYLVRAVVNRDHNFGWLQILVSDTSIETLKVNPHNNCPAYWEQPRSIDRGFSQYEGSPQKRKNQVEHAASRPIFRLIQVLKAVLYMWAGKFKFFIAIILTFPYV